LHQLTIRQDRNASQAVTIGLVASEGDFDAITHTPPTRYLQRLILPFAIVLNQDELGLGLHILYICWFLFLML
jgi:hypothetical protein